MHKVQSLRAGILTMTACIPSTTKILATARCDIYSERKLHLTAGGSAWWSCLWYVMIAGLLILLILLLYRFWLTASGMIFGQPVTMRRWCIANVSTRIWWKSWVSRTCPYPGNMIQIAVFAQNRGFADEWRIGPWWLSMLAGIIVGGIYHREKHWSFQFCGCRCRLQSSTGLSLTVAFHGWRNPRF